MRDPYRRRGNQAKQGSGRSFGRQLAEFGEGDKSRPSGPLYDAQHPFLDNCENAAENETGQP